MSTFQLNAPDVTFESFDAEVLAINLRSGHYYSLRGTAVPLWLLLVEGVTAAEAGQQLARATGANLAKVAEATEGFASALVKEALLVARKGDPAASSPVTFPASYSDPVLECYSDMQQLLQLDPVHDVDETGWPMRQAAKS